MTPSLASWYQSGTRWVRTESQVASNTALSPSPCRTTGRRGMHAHLSTGAQGVQSEWQGEVGRSEEPQSRRPEPETSGGTDPLLEQLLEAVLGRHRGDRDPRRPFLGRPARSLAAVARRGPPHVHVGDGEPVAPAPERPRPPGRPDADAPDCRTKGGTSPVFHLPPG